MAADAVFRSVPHAKQKKNDLTVFSEAYAEVLRKLRANAPSVEL